MHQTTKVFIPICILLIILDLFLKQYVVSNLSMGQRSQIIEGLLTVVHTQTVGNPFSFGGISSGMKIIKMIIFVLMLFAFFRFQMGDFNKGFKYASALIVFGGIGNFCDKIFIGKWAASYQHTDYIWFGPADAVFNISSFMSLIGWIIFIIIILIKPKELLSVFKNFKNNK